MRNALYELGFDIEAFISSLDLTIDLGDIDLSFDFIDLDTMFDDIDFNIEISSDFSLNSEGTEGKNKLKHEKFPAMKKTAT